MIDLINIHKRFGTTIALQGIHLKVSAGSIHGIIGENGAGKSTLMKVLTGYTQKNEGEIRFNQVPVSLSSPQKARQLGIGMLYQEPLDFPQLTVLDNFIAGAASFQPRKQRKELSVLADKFHFSLPPDAPLAQLTVGERQQLEFLRLMSCGVKVLILDEPTTGISEKQQELLFAALEVLREEGKAILLVSHKLEEVERLCDRVSVLRQGWIVDNQAAPYDRQALLEAMFDTLPQPSPPAFLKSTGKQIVVMRGVHSTIGRSGIKNLDLHINDGERVGLAGLDGSGQSVFLKIACGLLKPEKGTVTCFGRPPQPGASKHRGEGIVFLPSDRLTEGLIPGMDLREHHLLSNKKGLFLTPKSSFQETQESITTYNIKGRPETLVEDLSGGNQQRLLLSLIPKEVGLILMENPTRGLDVHSAAWTWNHLNQLLPEQGAMIFASPDLEEILEQATRILVFFEGNIVLDTRPSATSYKEISEAITGQVHHPKKMTAQPEHAAGPGQKIA